MICVRCLRDTAGKIADAPDGSGAWEAYFCETCHYAWRSDEPETITNIEKRNPLGQLAGIKDFQKEIYSMPEYRSIRK